MVGRAGVGPVQVLEEDHFLFEAAAAPHAGRPSAVADPGAVGQAGADAAQPAEVVQAGGRSSADQLDGSGGVLADETLRRNHRSTGDGYRGDGLQVIVTGAVTQSLSNCINNENY